jgi:hypothetical protein
VPQAPQAPQVDEAPVAQSKDDTDRFESMIEMDLPGVDEAQSILPARSKVPPPLEVAEQSAAAAAEAPRFDAPPVEGPPVKRPAEHFQIGANLANFLGGIPLPRPKLPPRRQPGGAPASADPVDDLIREIDTAAEAAARAQSDPSSPFVAVPPPVPGRPARRPRFGKKDEPAEATTPSPPPRALDESIPPFEPGAPATKSQITLGFDGLAMPPVRHADVFAQMSPPANQASDDESSPKGDPSALAGAAAAAGDVMTPMDMVEAPPGAAASAEAPARRGARRSPRNLSD